MSLLEKSLGEFQRHLQDAADEAEGGVRPKRIPPFQRGVAHGYRKAAEELGRWVLQGKIPTGEAGDA